MMRSKFVGLLVLVLVSALALAGCGGSGHHSTPAQHVYTTAVGSGHRAHSPTFGLPPNGIRALPPRVTAEPTYLMLDTTDDPASTFSGLSFTVVAGYTSGHWPTFWSMTGHYRYVIGIAVNVAHVGPADYCLDVEPGDATPGEVAGWIRAERPFHSEPCVYANLSEWSQIDADLRSAGIDPHSIFRWVAYWVYHPELIAGFDAQQWTDRFAGRNIDGSQVTARFAGIQSGPTPSDYLHWRKARDASLHVYQHSRCTKPVLGSAWCGLFAWRVNHFQLLVDQEGNGPKCFGLRRTPHAPVCQIVRPAVAIRSRAAASSHRHHNDGLARWFEQRIAHSLSTSRL